MVEFYLDDDRFALDAKDLIGEGGEAEVYKVGKQTAVKLFKQPSHPSYAGNSPQADLLRKAAAARLNQVQAKLSNFPSGLPANVVAPRKLAYDRPLANQPTVVGYTMDYVDNGQLLRQYTQRDFRESTGIKPSDIAEIFLDMHKTVKSLHSSGIVIGDFNVMNVLVAGKSSFFIDTDSMQFGNFLCQTYMVRYLDPLNATINSGALQMCASHTQDSDWYAFASLLFECLTYVHPYGGIHRPAPGGQRFNADQRLTNRINVFHPDVQYPQAALPIASLPLPLQEHFQNVFRQDLRGEFPALIIETLRGRIFTPTITSLHAPVGGDQQAFATPVFRTAGTILSVAWQEGKLVYLYHHDGRFFRETGACVLSGDINGQMIFKLRGGHTVVAKGNQIAVLSGASPLRLSADSYRSLTPAFDTNSAGIFVVDGGALCQYEGDRRRLIDDVLANQTRIWVGERFGFGFYQAGQIRKAFLFEPDGSSRVNLPLNTILGTPIDIRCAFSDKALWLLTSRNEAGTIINSCTVIQRDGRIAAQTETAESDDHWLGRIGGKCATAITAGGVTSNILLSADTDAVLQLQEDAGAIRIIKRINAPGVCPSDNLLLSNTGLYVWNSKEIRLLSTRTPDSVAAGSQPATLGRK